MDNLEPLVGESEEVVYSVSANSTHVAFVDSGSEFRLLLDVEGDVTELSFERIVDFDLVGEVESPSLLERLFGRGVETQRVCIVTSENADVVFYVPVDDVDEVCDHLAEFVDGVEEE